jgi:hypothetical protein
MEVKMVIAFYKGQGKGVVKVIKVEGGREKENDKTLICLERFKK